MANEMNIAQDFRTMTLNLPTDMVTIQVVVKTMKGQYRFAKIITIEKKVLTHGVYESCQGNANKT